MDSILNSIKKLIGISEDDSFYDTDLIIHINSAFMILKQIGVGPDSGFSIHDETSTWDEFTNNDLDLEPVKTYVYQKVKLCFDPPTSSGAMDALEKSIKEIEWRLNVAKDT